MKFSSKRSGSGIALLFGLAFLAAVNTGCSESQRVEVQTELEADKSAIAARQNDPNFVEVWKTPTCGCCAEWVSHLEKNGFTVKVNDVGNTDSFRAALGIPQQYGSCHSARVAGYAIEGHVPAADIRKLLDEKPEGVVGLSVPAMPMGSPGMEHPDFPSKRAEYDVLLIDKAGAPSTYTHYEAVN